MERKGTPHDVAYACSTWEKAKKFQEGIQELEKDMPLMYARTYLLSGVKSPDFPDTFYDRVDTLQDIRKSAIQAEMKYVLAQVYCMFRDGLKDENFLVEHSAHVFSIEEAKTSLAEALAKDEAAESEELGACARLLLDDAVMSGDDIRFGFDADTYFAAPSLGVYELFMWTTVEELDGLASNKF